MILSSQLCRWRVFEPELVYAIGHLGRTVETGVTRYIEESRAASQTFVNATLHRRSYYPDRAGIETARGSAVG
jgi:hypothetical protein